MEGSKSDVTQRINAIRARFMESLPAKRQELSARWNRIRHLGWEAESAAQVRAVAHRLAGTGTTFGFPEITRAAAAVDSALGKLDADDAPPPEKILLIGRKVDDLLRVLVTAVALPGPDGVLPDPDQGAGALVVLIDDDEFVRARLTALLEGAGYRVAAFADPDSALALLQSEQPAAVVLDLMFPGRVRPAFDVVAAIRGETGVRTPVILITARTDFVSRLDAARAGADAFLAKPLEDQIVLDTVEQFATRRADESWRCLVIEDDETLSTQILTWLREEGLVAEALASPQESWLRVREFHPDIVLLDINIPGCNGIELATMLRQDDATARLPIILMTSDRSSRTRRAAVAAGSDDFLLKPLERDVVVSSVIARARLGRRAHDQLGRVTQQGGLRGGLSRHFFFAELEKVLDEGENKDVSPALVLLTLSEAVGLMQQQGLVVAAALSQQFTERLGVVSLPVWSLLGDSLAGILLAPDTEAGHRSRLQQLVRRLESTPYKINGLAVAATVRAALLYLGQHGQTACSVALAQAEQLLGMALAGTAGTAGTVEGYLGRAKSATEIVGRLPVGRLRVVFQPIMTIDGAGVPVSAVLVRLTDSGGNLLPAGRFLAQVEERGWLPQLDAWVFTRVHAMLLDELRPDAPMVLIVTIGLQSLGSEIFVETVLATLSARPMRSDSQCLVISVPETAAVTHRGVIRKLNDALRAAGCGLMFTGYGGSANSVPIIEQFAPLFVRLDPAVSHRLEQSSIFSPSDRTLMDAAAGANVGVIASGIENARSLSALWSKGVRRFQGYFIQEPSSVLVPAAGETGR